MKGWKRAAGAGAILAVALCPAVAASKTDDILKGVEDLQQQVLLLTKEQARSAEAIAEIRRRLQEQQGAQQSVQADLLQQINALLDEIQILRQRLEDTGFRLANLTQEMRRLQAAPPSAPPSGTQTPAGAAPPAGPGGGAAAGAAAPDPAAAARGDADPQAAFQAAYADYSKGNFELAMWGFQDFLRRHRGHPLAGDAQYWIGECHFAQRDFRQAVAELDRLIQDFPDSPKVPVAHLKKGLAYLESNQVAQAVVQLQHLVQAYPRSDEARVARERLNDLGIR
jgi:tol-pal system protein YbgF